MSDTLHAVLSRVPLADLHAAIARRGILPQRAQLLQEHLAAVAHEHQLDPLVIMTHDRSHAPTTARWDLYRRLERAGLVISEIAILTGHERARIQYALKDPRAAGSRLQPA